MSSSRRAFLGTLAGGTVATLGAGCAARPARVAVPEGRGLIRIGSNENSYGPGPAARAAIERALAEANRYPFGEVGQLAEALAAHLGAGGGEVITGCGSGEILDAAVSAYTSPERGLVTAAPTFEAPARRAERLGAPVVSAPVNDDGRLDLQAMRDRSVGAGLVYLCNPNNPTSTVHGASDVRGFVEQVLAGSPGTTVLIDEAYHEYVEAPSYASAVPLALAHPRVIVTRTFSKIHGMAGLRVGYAVGQRGTLAPLGRWLTDVGMSIVGAVAGRASLGDRAHLEQQRAFNREARRRTLAVFERAGCRAFASEANFVMVNVGRDCRQFAAACLERGVRVARPFPPLMQYARISLGTLDEMTRACEVFTAALAEAPVVTSARSWPIDAGRHEC
jgi:histidinol-phosphate aminotransferase